MPDCSAAFFANNDETVYEKDHDLSMTFELQTGSLPHVLLEQVRDHFVQMAESAMHTNPSVESSALVVGHRKAIFVLSVQPLEEAQFFPFHVDDDVREECFLHNSESWCSRCLPARTPPVFEMNQAQATRLRCFYRGPGTVLFAMQRGEEPTAPPPLIQPWMHDDWSALIAPPASTSTLFDAVYDAPTCHDSRRVLADKLMVLGDPRGRFIQDQLNSSDAHIDEALSDEQQAAWLGPLLAVVEPARCTFQRGFPHRVKIGDAPAERLQSLKGHPAWRTVQVADLRDARIPIPDFQRIPELTIVGTQMNWFAQDGWSVRRLTVHNAAAEALVAARLDSVQHLELRGTRLSIDLAQRPWWQSLHSLFVRVTSASLTRIALRLPSTVQVSGTFAVQAHQYAFKRHAEKSITVTPHNNAKRNFSAVQRIVIALPDRGEGWTIVYDGRLRGPRLLALNLTGQARWVRAPR